MTFWKKILVTFHNFLFPKLIIYVKYLIHFPAKSSIIIFSNKKKGFKNFLNTLKF